MNNIKPQVIRELVISGDSVPIIIGTNGSTIKKLQEIYGVKMRFLGENEATYTERTLRITARDVVSADNALQKVEELLRNGPLWTEPAIEKPPQVIRQTTNSNPPYFGAERSAEQHIEDTYMLVYALFDQVAGKNDANFKSIKSSLSLAAMEVGGICTDDSGQKFRPIVLRGSADKVLEAKQMLQRMVDSFTSKQMDVPVPNNFDDNWGPPFPPPQRKGDGVQQQQQYQLSSGSSPPSLPTPPKSSYTRISNGVEHMATENGSSSSFSKISQMTQEIARLSAELEREHHRELAKAGGKSSNAEINELKRELQLREQQFDEVMFHNDQLKSKVDKLVSERKQWQQDMMNEHQFNKGANNQPSEHLMLCMECGRYPRDIVMMPCLHCTHCSRCGDHLPACKVCSRNIYSKLHILFENSVK